MRDSDSKKTQGDNARSEKFTFRQRFHHWATARDPAEDMVPLVALGVFAVVAGAITISLAVEYSQFLVYLGTAATILGAGTLTMALVLATLRRGVVRKNAQSTNDQQPSSSDQRKDTLSH